MRTWLVTVAVLGCCIVPLRADIGITQSRTVEGPAAVLTPDAGLPRVTMRIKGMKARTDVETYGHTVTAITDVETQQVMMLRTGSNIARVITPESAADGAPWQTPHIDVSLKVTGKSRMIDVMKGIGDMKMVQKVTVSTAPIAADLFTLPAGYTLEKR